MTDHLPECWATHESDPPAWCICDALRACEARVYQEQIAGRQNDMVLSYFRALDPAREAVAALPPYAMRDVCVSAIDAMKGDSDAAMTETYHRGFDDARWIAAKEALEGVQHENCDCGPCEAISRALAELRTIGQD